MCWFSYSDKDINVDGIYWYKLYNKMFTYSTSTYLYTNTELYKTVQYV